MTKVKKPREIKGAAFRKYREKLKLTREEMADRIGVTWETIKKWEVLKKKEPIPGYARNYVISEKKKKSK